MKNITAGEFVKQKYPNNTNRTYVRRDLEESMTEFAEIKVKENKLLK